MKTSKKGKSKKSQNKKPAKKASAAKKGTKKKDVKIDDEKSIPGKALPVILAIVLVIIIALVIIAVARNPDSDSGIPDEDKVKLEFYVMSQCPYGTQVEDAIVPVLENMGDAVDFRLEYIVQETSPGQFQSLHGEPEVKGNIVQLCAKSYYPEDYKYMDFIACQNQDPQNVATNWEQCAQELDMDVEKLRSCLESDEGINLLRTSMQNAIAREARASPTIYINDIAYQGGRDSLAFQRAICQHVEHEACQDIPECGADTDCTEQPNMIGVCHNPGEADAYCSYEEPVKVEYYVLTAAGCEGSACDPTRLVQVLQQLFKGAQPRPVEAGTEQGQELIEQYGIEKAPAFIFDSSITETASWQTRQDLRSAFEKTGDKYKLKDEATGATHYVSEEARQAHYQAIGVTPGDNTPQIDFFVMSYCPYGNQAEEGIEPVYQLLKDQAEFNPKYVIYSNYRGGGSDFCIDDGNLCSMHGVQELNQNVREACVAKHIGMDEWFEFALAMNEQCNSQNADSCWEAVAENMGLDTELIKQCEQEEAVELMSAHKAIGDNLGVRGSPAVYIEGQAYSGARTPEAYKQALCAAFDEAPEECDTTLEGSTQEQPQGSC